MLRNFVLSTDLDQKPLQKSPGRFPSTTMPAPPKSGVKLSFKSVIGQRPNAAAVPAPKPPHLPVRPVPSTCTLRGKLWKILLGVVRVDAERYIHLVEHGPCEKHDLILVDLKRTFKSDASFQAAVSQDKLIRVLNAFDRWCKGQVVADPVRFVAGFFLSSASLLLRWSLFPCSPFLSRNTYPTSTLACMFGCDAVCVCGILPWTLQQSLTPCVLLDSALPRHGFVGWRVVVRAARVGCLFCPAKAVYACSPSLSRRRLRCSHAVQAV